MIGMVGIGFEREFRISNRIMFLLYSLIFLELTPWATFKVIVTLISLLFLLSLMELLSIFLERLSYVKKVFKG